MASDLLFCTLHVVATDATRESEDNMTDINNNDTNLDREEIESEDAIEDDKADDYMQRLAQAIQQKQR